MAKFGSKIKVLGIGGAGVNVVSRMAKLNFDRIELFGLNTDVQSLKTASLRNKVLIGENTTGGLGTGMDVKLGKKALLESKERISEVLEGTDVVFIVAGLGGGTGSVGVGILGEMAKALDILTIAVVTTPFSFEGGQRQKIASWAVQNLKGKADSFVAISNDKLLGMIGKTTSITEAFLICDQVLWEAVRSISELMYSNGIINVDFADVRQILKNSGRGLFGWGRAQGPERAMKAADLALRSPLVEFPIKKAQGLLLNINGDENLSLWEVKAACDLVEKNIQKSTKTIFGVREDKTLKSGELKITLIATGF